MTAGKAVILISVMTVSGWLFGDMGAIIPSEAVTVSEPGQKALILHNGREEILVLETDLRSDRKTPVLRFIPLPSRPVVSAAPKGIFSRLESLVREKNLRYLIKYRGGAGVNSRSPVTVVSYQKIGAHEITVVWVGDPAHFRKWAAEFLGKKKIAWKPDDSRGRNLTAVVADYVKRDIRYFVFDFVNLDPGDRTVEPIAYRFPSKNLFYPLKTSNLFGGRGDITLFIAAPTARDFNFFPGFGFELSSTAPLLRGEIEALYPGGGKFAARSGKKLILQSVRYSGKLEFDGDLIFNPARGADELLPSENE